MSDDSPTSLAEASQPDSLTHTFDGPDGNEYEIEVREPTMGEIEALERRADEGDLSEDEAQELLWDEYLLDPDLDYKQTGASWIAPITNAIYSAFAGGEDIDEALDAVQTDEGNG
jgi:hypothetical protein